MYNIAKNISLSLILISFIGCATPPTIYSGVPIDGMNNLDQLKQGMATVQDVRNMMGKPSGYGKTRFKPDLELLDVWFYQYMESTGSDAHINIVLIFIDKDNTYQGHLAFTSDALVEGLIVDN